MHKVGRRKLEAYRASIRNLFTDDEYDTIAKLLGVDAEDNWRRFKIALLIMPRGKDVLPLSRQRELVQAVKSAAASLKVAIEKLADSHSELAAALGVNVGAVMRIGDDWQCPSMLWLDYYGTVLNYVQSDTHSREDVAEDVADDACAALEHIVRACTTTHNSAVAVLRKSAHRRSPVGRRPDRARDEVATWAGEIFFAYRRRAPTLITDPLGVDVEPFRGEFFELARIMDQAHLRLRNRDPRRVPKIGSVLKRLTTNWRRERRWESRLGKEPDFLFF